MREVLSYQELCVNRLNSPIKMWRWADKFLKIQLYVFCKRLTLEPKTETS